MSCNYLHTCKIHSISLQNPNSVETTRYYLIPTILSRIRKTLSNINENVRRQALHCWWRSKTGLAVLEKRVDPRVPSRISYAYMTMKSYSWIHTLGRLLQIHERLYKDIHQLLLIHQLCGDWGHLNVHRGDKEKVVNAHHEWLCSIRSNAFDAHRGTEIELITKFSKK